MSKFEVVEGSEEVYINNGSSPFLPLSKVN